jgi:hypothetical protein
VNNGDEIYGLRELLRPLEPWDCGAGRSRLILSQALQLFEQNRGPRGWFLILETVYTRYLEPAWVAVYSLVCLVWACSAALSLLR